MSFTGTRHDEGIRLEEGVPPTAAVPRRRAWIWFWAAFSVVVLLGASILYVAGRPGSETPVVADDAAPPEQAALGQDEAPPAEEPVAVPATQTSAVLLGTYIVDSFGFHGLAETYTEATEVGERDAARITNVIAAIDTVDWPDELTSPIATLRTDLTGLVAALDAADLDAARDGFDAVHTSQHDASTSVYGWLPSTPVIADEPVVSAAGVIEIDMFEFGYAPAAIQLEAGVPTVLRFTNSGKLQHEAMVGDAHMQEEFASAGDHDDGAGGDHHGDLMAVVVNPGETADLEVVIDEPGTWFVACHLVGHYEQGQVAEINVTG